MRDLEARGQEARRHEHSDASHGHAIFTVPGGSRNCKCTERQGIAGAIWSRAAMIGWILAALAAIALMVIGVGALLAPRTSAAQYGIVVDDPRALAFIRAMGVRDLLIGVLLGLVSTSGSRGLAAWALYATTAIAMVDWVLVTIDGRAGGRGDRHGVPSRLLHLAGGLGLLLAGTVLQAGY